MTDAVTALNQGIDYQARYFWLQACRLFEKHSKVEKVGYELDDIRSFDDVAVFYREPIPSEREYWITADFYQIKFHVDHAGAFKCENLMDPKFIGAQTVSLLQRLKSAVQKHCQDGKGCRFYIVSPWGIHPDDPLAKLVSNNGGEIRFKTLFAGGPRSEMGRIRSEWCSHLGITDENELRQTLSPLRIQANTGDLKDIRERLNLQLSLAGLQPVGDGEFVHPYDDLIRKVRATGRKEFHQSDIEAICKREGLWKGKPAIHEPAIPIGIKSFSRWAEYMEDKTEKMLSLVPCFDNRQIKDPVLWNQEVVPKLADFLSCAVSKDHPYHLYLDTHVSIAFAAGHCINAKSGIDIVPVQSTLRGKVVWNHEDVPQSKEPLWIFSEEVYSNGSGDIAVAISATHPILEDVKLFVKNSLPSVGRIMSFTIDPKPGPTSVRDGSHAFLLAQEVVSQVTEKRSQDEHRGNIHLFAAGPNALMFFLGRIAQCFGRCILYEYDFDNMIPGAYQSSITFPFSTGGPSIPSPKLGG